MSTHSTLLFTAPGPSFTHSIHQTTTPTIASDQVLIRNKAISINPLDYKRIAYNVLVNQWPTSGGFEVAGIVEAVGDEVKHVRFGDAVVGVAGNGGGVSFGFQEKTRLDGRNVVSKPKGLSFEEAVSLPNAIATAVSVLHFGLGARLPFLKAPEASTVTEGMKTVLILGGSSSIGATAIQLLRFFSPEDTVILTTSSAKHADHLKALGASHVFDRSSSSLINDIRDVAPHGVNGILDLVGAAGADKRYLTLFAAKGTRIMAPLVTGTDVVKEDVPEGVVFRGPLFTGALYRMVNGTARMLAMMVEEVERGRFRLPVEVRVVGEGLESVVEGLEIAMAGVSGQKLVVSL